MKQSTLNHCWKPLWPDCIRTPAVPDSHEDAEILLLAHAVGGEGFDDFSHNDIAELLKVPIIDDDALVECVSKTDVMNSDDSDDDEFPAAVIEEGLQMAAKLADFFYCK